MNKDINTAAVLSAAKALTGHLPADEAFRGLADVLNAAAGVDRASLAIYDEAKNDFVVVAVQLDEESKWGSGLRLPRTGTRVGEAFNTRAAQLGTNLALDQPFQEDHFLAEEGMNTGLALPLISDAGHTVGTLNIDWREEDAVTPQRMALFEQIARIFANSSNISWWVPQSGVPKERQYSAEQLLLKRPSLAADVPRLKKLAATDASILVTGGTGAGKGVIARGLHEWSQRSGGPFIKCDCAALTTSLIESDLFGHERGSFTGATRQRIGRFELANKGTVFLDEIGELPLEFQPKLLGVIEDRTLMRVGGAHELHVDVRIISATNRDLLAEVADHAFRADLYHRVGVLEYRVPDLKDCPDDIVALANFFVADIAMRIGRQPPRLENDAIGNLKAYHWPGNVRELSNVMERAMLLSEGRTLVVDDYVFARSSHASAETGADSGSESDTLAAVEAAHIRRILAVCGGKIAGHGGAAERLGLHPNTLRSRMQKLGVRGGDE